MGRALVTGAASGLGASLTRLLRERGDEVLATDRVEGADLRLDVTDPADWERARAEVESRWGGLDLLINNAGIAGGGRLDVATLEEWRRLVDVNLLGVVQGTRTFVPMLKAQGSGRIVNVASLAGLVHPAGMAAYNATKAAVVALTETTAHELAPYGVTASVVCPSYFRTGLTDTMTGADEAFAQIIARLVAEAPFGPDEIAAAVIEGIDHGDELILPDPAARAAYELKVTDRAAYDDTMRQQAQKVSRLP